MLCHAADCRFRYSVPRPEGVTPGESAVFDVAAGGGPVRGLECGASALDPGPCGGVSVRAWRSAANAGWVWGP